MQETGQSGSHSEAENFKHCNSAHPLPARDAAVATVLRRCPAVVVRWGEAEGGDAAAAVAAAEEIEGADASCWAV